MKLFHQAAPCAAAMVCEGPHASTRKCLVHCFLVLALAVLGLAIVGPLHAETIPPRRLLEVTDLGNPAISPDGRYVAFRTERALVERNTYESTWYVQDLDGKAPPLRVADGGTPMFQYENGTVLPSPTVWSPDGEWIYYRARFDGRVSVWRAATDGSGSREVTSDPADVRDFALGSDGKTLTYSVGATRKAVIAAEEAEYDRGIRIDETTNNGDELFRSSKIEGRPSTQRYLGGWSALGPLLAQVPDHWKAVNLATMATRSLSASEQPAHRLSPADLSPDLPAEPLKIWDGLRPQRYQISRNPGDERVAVLLPERTPKGAPESRHVELAMLPDRRASRPVYCTDDLCHHIDISDIQWRPGSDEVLFTVDDYDQGHSQSIYGWNVITGKVRPVVLSRGIVSGSQRYWDIPCAASADALVCVAAEADHPPRLEAIAMDGGDRRVLYAPNQGLEADIEATVPARLIRWKDANGHEFTGQLFEARGASAASPPPLFVTLYNCYGFLRGGVGDEWPLATLAGDGISALCINSLPDASKDRADHYNLATAAVESVVEQLSAEGRIDPTRVGMGGLSYGSEVTMWTLVHSDVLSAASAGVATTLNYYQWQLREGVRSGYREGWGLGTPEETPERWRELAPVYQLDRIKAPILFQMSEQEYRSALEYAIPLIRRHQADMYVFPYEPHIKYQPQHKLAVYERNVDWFRFWLQGYEDPSPQKAAQYRIWREMKKAGTHHFDTGDNDKS